MRLLSLCAFALALAVQAEEVERVLALVNGVPVLASDVELARLAGLVPRLPQEDEAAYQRAVLEALVALELRYQDLAAAHLEQRLAVDWPRAWGKVVEAAGGEEALRGKLAAAGLSLASLQRLVRRAALVEAYVAKRLGSGLRVTQEEVASYYRSELLPAWPASQGPPPPLEDVRQQVEAILRERKLSQEVERWTRELAQRGEVIRYSR